MVESQGRSCHCESTQDMVRGRAPGCPCQHSTGAPGLGGELWAEERMKWCSGARGKELLLLPPEHGKCFSSPRVI